eukprot:TRINITY_DN28584_c0_g1_i1.p1 TRINITY_DN28584_c0_g1~~TRINITY_DN28584_c0_g1_i1.p1  ORF type:complete len:471 (-),score=34.66 TRINITY_DN28584_c0_g1_i1:49-1461(-)
MSQRRVAWVILSLVVGKGEKEGDPRLTPVNVKTIACGTQVVSLNNSASFPWICKGGAGSIQTRLSSYAKLLHAANALEDSYFAAAENSPTNETQKRTVVFSGYGLPEETVDEESRGVSSWSFTEISWLWEPGKVPPLAAASEDLPATLWMAKAGVSYAMHFDQLGEKPWHNGFYLLQLVGRKVVRLVHPNLWALLHLHPWCHAFGLDTQIPDLKGDLVPWLSLCAKYELLCAAESQALSGMFYRAQLSPGDILYIPPAWFHETDADEDTASLRILPDILETSFLPSGSHEDVVDELMDILNEARCSACSFLRIFIPHTLGKHKAFCLVFLLLESIYKPAARGERCGASEALPVKQNKTRMVCGTCRTSVGSTANWIGKLQKGLRGLAIVAVGETLLGRDLGKDFIALQRAWEFLLEDFGSALQDRKQVEGTCLSADLASVRADSSDVMGDLTMEDETVAFDWHEDMRNDL